MTCIHYWLCDEGTQNVHARCKLCGDTRIFRAMLGEPDNWGGGVTTSDFRRRNPVMIAASRARGGAIGGAANRVTQRARKAAP